MKDNILYLSAAREPDQLKIGLYKDADVIRTHETVSVPMQNVEARCRELTEMLNRITRQGRGGVQKVQELRLQGQHLCRELLPGSIRQQLNESRAEYLILHLDISLLGIPWELLCPDEDFLCFRFSVGRRINVSGKTASVAERFPASPLGMWIIANPKGDLAAADTEGETLFEETLHLNTGEAFIEPVLDSDVSPQDVKNHIKSYDMLHFAGHVRYDVQTPQNSGWELSGGRFTVADIDSLTGGMAMPSFVFSNACQSARTEENGNGFSGSGSLAEAFLRAGVRHYIGTCWEIPDVSGRDFALRFYRHFGSGIAIGRAVRESRKESGEDISDISRLAYVLYGDPRSGYFAQSFQEEKAEISGCRNKPYTRGEKIFPLKRSGGNDFWNHLLIRPLLWIFLIMLVAGIVTGRFIMQKADAYEERKIRQSLMERADRIQQKTERLVKELAELVSGLPKAENPEIPAIAMLFDSHAAAGPKEKMILFAVQSQLMESQNYFRLLERESFDKVLEEIIRRRRLRPEERHSPLKLIFPRLLVIFEMNYTGDVPVLLMRVTDAESGELLANLFQKVEEEQPVLAQKKKIADPLLCILKKKEKGS